jgi:hypothetical protein
VKRVLIALLLCLMVPVSAMAAMVTESLSWTWDYSVEAETEITGFTIYQVTGTLPEKAVIQKIPKTARTATGMITYDNAVVNRFYIRAYNDSNPDSIEYSGPSNTYRLHVAPGQFRKR